ncbi:MAG: hypothetical protein CMP71_03890 [Flavobacteriales bacterium]|nr:hypothetical protein [Flavobacteriales bacterium]
MQHNNLNKKKNVLPAKPNLIKKIFLIAVVYLSACANVIPPSGGPLDKEPPRLVSNEILVDSNKLKKVDLLFDENISLNNWSQNFYISPPSECIIKKNVNKRKLSIYFEPYFLIEHNYKLSLSNVVKDYNEGNILDSLEIKSKTVYNNTLKGTLKCVYDDIPLQNHWITLYCKSIYDSLIFKELPSYVTKSDENGVFKFEDVKPGNYKLLSIENNFNFYDFKEYVAFSDKYYIVHDSSFIDTYLNAYNSELSFKNDSVINDTLKTNNQIIVNLNKDKNLVLELYNNQKLIKREQVINKVCIINNLKKGEYSLKYFIDLDSNKIFSNGSFLKKQPEKKLSYNKSINVLENWSTEVDLIID